MCRLQRHERYSKRVVVAITKVYYFRSRCCRFLFRRKKSTHAREARTRGTGEIIISTYFISRFSAPGGGVIVIGRVLLFYCKCV